MTFLLIVTYLGLALNVALGVFMLILARKMKHPRKMRAHATTWLRTLLDDVVGEDFREPDLNDDDMNSALCTAFGQGAGYFTNEAANAAQAGNKKGALFNVAKARYCQHLYELARTRIGKPINATDEERVRSGAHARLPQASEG